MKSNTQKTFTLEISDQELISLIKWHSSQAKGIAKRFGECVLKTQAKGLFGRSREVMELKKMCEDDIQKHSLRAKGLLSLLKL